MRRSEDLVFEIVKSNQLLFEDLGTVRALFPGGTELDKLIDRIYRFGSLKTAEPPSGASVEPLVRWKNEAGRQLHATVEQNYAAPIDELLVYLSKNLPAD